jgi:hypothetical protein
VLAERIADAMTGFIAASPWLKIARHHGAEALTSVFHQVRTSAATPDQGHIILPA